MDRGATAYAELGSGTPHSEKSSELGEPVSTILSQSWGAPSWISNSSSCPYFAPTHLPVSVSAGVAAVAAAGIAADGGTVLRPLISRKRTVPASFPLTYTLTSLMLLRSIALSASAPLNHLGWWKYSFVRGTMIVWPLVLLSVKLASQNSLWMASMNWKVIRSRVFEGFTHMER